MLAPLGRALASVHHHAIHLPRVDRIVAAGVELLRATPGPPIASLLDVGCGDGTIGAGVAAGLGCSVRGVDVKVRPGAAIDVQALQGDRLPFDDDAFDAVLLTDVLHHAADPQALLTECVRVGARYVLIKDHLTFGVVSDGLLWLMDVVGNAAPGVETRGHYLALPEWFELVGRAGGRLTAMRWPLRIHDLPWRLVTRSELQFAALVETAPSGGAP